jgi:MoxR-like ATPase
MERDGPEFYFVGRGDLEALRHHVGEIRPWGGTIGPWRPRRGHPGVTDSRAEPNHPANYRARQDLADAVNTALALSKPLLLTGSPGTGKSQLAERIAWELNLGPVLRFEAQSLSEATDLFYRFDLVGHLAAVEMFKSAVRRRSTGDLAEQVRREEYTQLAPERFVKLGPLGEAIVRSAPSQYSALFDAVFGPGERASDTEARPSVVLIDEIDKASRDFPNDLLNGIDRLEFRIRELGLDTMTVDESLRPIVVITSNSERDLPGPFLRRCTFFHIGDHEKEELAEILAQRFFAGADGNGGAPHGPGAPAALPPFYRQLVERFWAFRVQHGGDLHYKPGTSELIDWADALRRRRVPGEAEFLDHVPLARETASAVSKHRDDHHVLREFLMGLERAPGVTTDPVAGPRFHPQVRLD